MFKDIGFSPKPISIVCSVNEPKGNMDPLNWVHIKKTQATIDHKLECKQNVMVLEFHVKMMPVFTIDHQ